MTEQTIDPALGDLSDITPQKLQFAARRDEAVKRVKATPKESLFAMARILKMGYDGFWNDPKGVKPPAIVVGLDEDPQNALAIAKSMFYRHHQMSEVLRGIARDGGLSEAVIAELLPGSPDDWVVNIEATTPEAFITPRVA